MKVMSSTAVAATFQGSTSQSLSGAPGFNPYPVDQAASLIISFPSKFPSQGVPSYTLRGNGVRSYPGCLKFYLNF